MKNYTPKEKHSILIDLLKSHPATESLVIKKRETTGSSSWINMKTNDINSGVVLLSNFWNLSGGSVGGFDLYKLLQRYLKDKATRAKINEIINGV
jgi:hypothetical protein